MKIPDFLRPENRKPLSPQDVEMARLVKEYIKEIGDDLITESSTYTTQEWIDMLNECLEKHITIWELWGEEYNPEADY
ncbi:MAG: hypothetical protein K2N61_13200 [Lachnospiraceae bacterium]|nr:hypothetical protein [Lachnospiraceae bacterium]